MDGFAVAKRLREFSSTYLIMPSGTSSQVILRLKTDRTANRVAGISTN